MCNKWIQKSLKKKINVLFSCLKCSYLGLKFVRGLEPKFRFMMSHLFASRKFMHGDSRSVAGVLTLPVWCSSHTILPSSSHWFHYSFGHHCGVCKQYDITAAYHVTFWPRTVVTIFSAKTTLILNEKNTLQNILVDF